MTRRKITPERREQRKKLLALLQDAGINDVAGVQELFKEMVGTVLENGLEGELEEELGYSKYDYRNKDTDNSRNGYSEKTLKTSMGDLELAVPRDRKGEFEPQMVKKNQTTLSGDIEEKILSMYAKGMTTGDIEAHIREIYGLEVSDTTISRVTDKILPVVKEWQMRPLEEIYAVVFMDAVHFHVRSEGQIVKKAVYVAIGVKSLHRMRDTPDLHTLNIFELLNVYAVYLLGLIHFDIDFRVLLVEVIPQVFSIINTP